MLKDCFSTREVLEVTGVSARQLQWWDERRIVIPSRSGRIRIYSLSNLVDILLIEQLRRRGVSLAQVRRVLRMLRAEIPDGIEDLLEGRSQYHLLLDGRRVFLETDTRQVLDLLQNSMQPMLLISLAETVKPLTISLANLLEEPQQKISSSATTGGHNVKKRSIA
jgi:DNA-binding transcriptional MerR regulator